MPWRRSRATETEASVDRRAGEPRSPGQSRARELFFRTDGAEPGPVIVVHHIEKTAGTSLREVVRANLPPVEAEIAPDLRPLRYDPDEALRWYRDWYRSLAEERRRRLCCAMSHTAGYLLPALDRPFDALVLVRRPVDRVLSFYSHKWRNHARKLGPEAPFNLLEKAYQTLGRGRAPRAWQQFFNWQSRSLLSIFHDVSDLPISAGPPPDADVWRERLHPLVDEVFVVGVQDRFDEYVRLLSRRYGWRAFVPRNKVNPRPAAAEVAPEMIETIRAYNWLDAELYELCSRVQDRAGIEASVRAAG